MKPNISAVEITTYLLREERSSTKARIVNIISVNEGGTNRIDIILADFIDRSFVNFFDEYSNYPSGQTANW